MTAPRGFRPLAVATSVFAYALVALSPIVRITGSGLGCGDNWPLCNGRLIPDFHDFTVAIEWGHRLAAAGVSALVVLLALGAWLQRDRSGVSGRGGILRPASLALVLLVAQVLLGALTVWLELPAAVVILHLGNAMALLAAVLLATFRTWPTPASGGSAKAGRGVLVAAGLGALALLLGGLVANLHAGTSCVGFPLCNGRLWPAAGAGGLAHVHWAHRLVAYGLLAHVIALWPAFRRRNEPPAVVAAVVLALAVLAAHVVVAALLVLQGLPFMLRTAHAALGTLVWVSLVYLVWRVRVAAETA